MSRTIDERVVSMEFDNSKFESNVKTSLSTLDKLKEALKFSGASKGIEDFSSSIEQTGNKFSALEVIATGALLRIGSQAVTLGERLVKSLSLDQISAGWQKFADKTTSVATLVAQGNAIEEVNSQLDRLNWFTDETSYNFTEMVANIAKFTATGKGLEESVNAMEGIATWAALSGQNASTASRAMYQLSQAMGSGYMRLEDYKSIQNASMDTDEFRQKCLDAAVALGTLKKTGDDTYTSLVADTAAFSKSQFAKSLTYGQWFTSDVMMKVFSEYASAVDQIYKETERTGELASEVIDKIRTKAKRIQAEKIGIDETEAVNQAIKELGYNFDAFGLKAFEAAQKARTFRDVLDSVKDAVSTGWMNTFELIFGNAEKATEMWTDLANGLWDIFAGPGEARNEWLKEGLSSGWDRLASRIESTGVELEVFENKIIELAKQNGINIDELIAKYGSLGEVFSKGAIVGKQASSLIEGAIKSLSGEAEQTKVTLESVQQVVDDIWNGKYKNNPDRKKLMEEAGYDYEAYQAIVNKTAKGAKIAWDEITDAEKKAFGLTNEQILSLEKLEEQAEETGIPLEELINNITKPSGRELLINTFYNVLGAIKNVIVPIQEAFQSIFLDSEGLYSAIEYWNNLSKKLVMSEQTVDKLRRTFEGLFAVADIVLITIKDITKGIFEFVGKITGKLGLKGLSSDILNFSANMGDAIVEFRDKVKEIGLFKAAFGDFADYLISIWPGVKEAISELLGSFLSLDSFSLENVLKVLSDFKTKLKELLSSGELGETYGTKVIKVLDTISKGLKIAWNWIQNAWNAVKNYLSPAVEAIKELITEFKNLDKISISNIWNILNNFGKKIIEAFNSDETKEAGKNIVAGFIKGITSGIITAVKAISEFVSKIISTAKGLLGIESPSKIFMAIGAFCIAGLLLGFSEGFEPIREKLSELVNTIVEIFSKVDWNKVFVIGTILAFIYTVNKMVGSINTICNTIKTVVSPISEITKSITGFFGALKTAVTDLKNAKIQQMKASTFKDFATAIAILVGAITALTLLDPEKVKTAGIELAIIAGALIAFAKLSEFVKPTDFGKVSILLLGMSVAVGILSFVVKQMKEVVDLGDMASTIASFIVTLGLMYVLALSMSKIGSSTLFKSGKNLVNAGVMLIAMAGAILILAYVIKTIAAIPEGTIVKALAFITSIEILFSGLVAVSILSGEYADKAGNMLIKMSIAIGILVLVVRMLASSSENDVTKALQFIFSIEILFAVLVAVSKLSGEHASKAGAMLWKMSVAIGILALVVKTLASTSDSDIKKTLDFILSIEILFGAIIAVSLLAGENADKAGKMLIRMGIAIGILAVVVKLLVSTSEEDVNKALKFIASVEILFMGLIAVSSLAGENADKAGNMLMKMSVPILVLVAVIALLSFLEPDDVIRGTACVSALMAMMALIIAATKNVNEKVLTKLLVISGAISILVGLVYILATQVDTDKAIAATGELIALLLSLSVAVKIISSAKFTKANFGKVIGVMYSLVGVVALLGTILAALSYLNVEASIKTVGSLCALLLVMSIVTTILSTVKFDKGDATKAIITMAGLSLVLALLGGVLWEIQALQIDASIQNVIALSILLTAMSAITVILGKFGTGALTGAVEGLAALVVAVTVIGSLVGTLGWLSEQFPKMEEFLSNGIPILDKIGLAIGSFVGNIVGGLLGGIANGALSEVGTGLSNFMTNAQPFFDGIKNIKESSVEGAKNVAKIILALVGVSIINGLSSIFGGISIDDLKDDLCTFGDAVVAFSNKLSEGNINTETIETTKNAAEIVSALYEKLPKKGGLAQAIFGEAIDLGTFATQMEAFGKAIVTFSSIVSAEGSVNQEAVQAAVAAGEIIATLYEKLPREGGWAQTIFGGTIGLDTFGTQMAAFGTAIVEFSAKVSSGAVNELAVDSAVKAGNLVATLYDKLPKDTEGLSHAIFGGTMSLTEFAIQMKYFASGIVNFSNLVSKNGIDAKAVSSAVSAGKVISGLYNTLPKEEGVLEKITNFFAGGGTMSMDDFGAMLSGYGRAVAAFYKSLSEVPVDGLNNAVAQTQNLTDMMSSMKDLDASGVDAFKDGISKLSEINATKLVEAFGSSTETVTNAVNGLIASIGTAIINSSSQVQVSVSTLMANVVTYITLYGSSFMNAGSVLIKKFKDGVVAEIINAEAAISNMMTKCKKIVTSVSLYNAGIALVDGFASGITDETFAAEAAARAMAEAALEAAREALDINSPSKVFRKLAYSVPEGFAQGIDRMQSVVKTSAVDMAQTAIDSTKTALIRIGSVANSDIDITPTIRPVVDLDAFDVRTVQLGANINASISGPVNSLSSIIANAQNEINASNNEVISAISGLRADINAIYNGEDQEVALYVDSKKLASTLAKPMNRQLNILSKRGAY